MFYNNNNNNNTIYLQLAEEIAKAILPFMWGWFKCFWAEILRVLWEFIIQGYIVISSSPSP